ncbi:hypothetical protein GG344DRAFT_26077, partial [Lentinula edodes]
YKRVAQRVQPIPTVMPDYAKVIRRFPKNPLLSLPNLSPNPTQFTSGVRLTEDRLEGLGVLTNSFLWPEERLLMADVLKKNELGIAWDETEKGRFREDYFPPLKIPTIAHTPWAEKTLPIPPGIRDKVIQLVREKVASGLYEPSNSSYRSQWFVVAKSDG